MPKTYMCVLLGCLLVPATASADPTDAAARAQAREESRDEHTHEAHDYSRFSDGPRNVPTPRGASQERAQALGLGTRQSARRLLRGAPEARWVRAAGWREGRSDRLLWPVEDGGYVRGYGYVRRTRPDLLHRGVDISAAPGTVVRAAADGIVAYSDNGIRGYGNCVLIVHPNGRVTLYAHNERTTVQPGWRVRRGERIALVGNTGISRGPHLHFELRDGGPAVNPIAFFDGGPAHVRRVNRGAAARGGEGSTVRADDYRDEGPLPAAPAASDNPSTGGPALGSRALLRRLRRFAVDAPLLESVGGRRFRNLLWPARGGSVRAHSRRGVRLHVSESSAARAAADGQVVYVDSGASGTTVALVHPMGWVTVLTGLASASVTVGERVQRGAWIGTIEGGARFELVDGGRRVDPLERLVRVPE